ncbi:hypothetical protein FB451DRAFT_422986 [Mycena latifolia]|nr:hypothetical protein FB451DRAFT_422986 [Mycena latifolia]
MPNISFARSRFDVSSVSPTLRLSILSPVGIDLDNGMIAEMARTWNRIESLELVAYHSYGPPPRLTLESLESFAIYCRSLCKLAITFDGSALLASQDSTGHGLPQSSLRHLNVDRSPIKVPMAVARFITGIFSHVETLRTEREDQDNDNPEELDEHLQEIEWHRGWKEVEALLPHLAAIRAEERARVQQGAAVPLTTNSGSST